MKHQTTERHFVLRAHIAPDPEQPRKHFDKEKLQELADSFGGKAEGIHTDLLVRPDPKKEGRFILVAGERRWRAAELVKIERLPVRVVSESEAAQALKLQLTENMQRENMTALEEAAGAQKLLAERRHADPKFSVEQLGGELGLKRAATYELLALNKVSASVKAALQAGKIDPSKARLFATVPQDLHPKLLKEAMGDKWDGPMSVRELSDHIAQEYTRQLSSAPFPTQTEWKVGNNSRIACKDCSLRSGNIEGFTGNPNICTAVTCFDGRVKDFNAQTLAQAAAAGKRTLPPEKYLNVQHQFRESDDSCWEDRKNRTYSALAKKAGIEPMLTVDAENKLVKVFSPDDMAAIKKANNIKSSAGGNSAYRKQQAEWKKLNEALLVQSKLATAEMLPKLVTKAGIVGVKLWQLLADAVVAELGFDRMAFIAQRRELTKTKNDASDVLEAWLSNKKRTAQDLQEFVVEALLCAEQIEGWNKPVFTDLFKEAAELCGVDLSKFAAKPVPAKQSKPTAKKK